MSRKTIAVDSETIDKTLEDLANLYFDSTRTGRKQGGNRT
jgi:hypothetical protein